MSTREKTLAVLLTALIFAGVGGTLGYLLILKPLWEKQNEIATIDSKVEELRTKVKKLRQDVPRLAVANKRSLPTDQSLATREYYAMMEQLVRKAYGNTIPPGLKIEDKKITEVKTTTLPGQQPKKAPYTRIALEVEFKKADMWAVHDFLAGYYRLNLLQQITVLSIKRDDDGAGAAKKANAPDRKDLTVKLTTEALILEGADPRRTLLPVSNGFAAVGGLPGYAAIALTPEASRGITPTQFVQVLATRPRDYTLIVRQDPFHGPYIDPKAPPPKPDTPVVVKQKEDISNSIKLVSSLPCTDGTARAIIRDSYNPHNYEIEANARGVKVTKFTPEKGRARTPPKGVPLKDNLLVISDDNVSATSRTFKVVAIDGEGLIVLDLTPPKAEEKTEAKTEAKTERKWPPRPAATTDEAPMPRAGLPAPTRPPTPAAPPLSTPLAGAIGAAAASAGPKPPRVYRWGLGKTLKGLVELSPEKAEQVLKQASVEGPVRGMLAAAAGE